MHLRHLLKSRSMELRLLESNIGYVFRDKSLLETAITHSSFDGNNNYENLEFLGDSILGFVTAKYLYNHFDLHEGDLSKIRAKLVNAKELCKVANSLDLSQFVRLGNSYKNMQISYNILADMVEAIIAGIYLDDGMDSAEKFILDKIIISYDNITNIIKSNIDYKTMLQERYQVSGNVDIEYVVVDAVGKSNDMTFTIELHVNGETLSTGVGKSKREAEQNAAKSALNM